MIARAIKISVKIRGKSQGILNIRHMETFSGQGVREVYTQKYVCKYLER